MMPGEYFFKIIEEVPQVGCCFRSVITKQLRITLSPGQEKQIKLGGTDLPFLRGKITDSKGQPLHGIWVRLDPQQKSQIVFSEITDKDGRYQIFDIPPGEYKLHCFRRLALNNYSRTIQTTVDVSIEKTPNTIRAENIRNISIDLEPFMPLEYSQPAPPLTAKLLTGRPFNLQQQKGKIVVLHFYASWCSTCVSSITSFSQLADKFGNDKVLVVGISLDENIEDCSQFIAEHNITHPQIFAGPWKESSIRKAFHVINVPTTFIIDPEGKIAQIDLFGTTLKAFINNLLNF